MLTAVHPIVVIVIAALAPERAFGRHRLPSAGPNWVLRRVGANAAGHSGRFGKDVAPALNPCRLTSVVCRRQLTRPHRLGKAVLTAPCRQFRLRPTGKQLGLVLRGRYIWRNVLIAPLVQANAFLNLPGRSSVLLRQILDNPLAPLFVALRSPMELGAPYLVKIPFLNPEASTAVTA